MSPQFIFYLLLLFIAPSSKAEDCLSWFINSNLTPNTSDCELKCAMTPVDMGNFSCPNQCEDLCAKSIPEHVLAYVPRLTESEKTLIAKKPHEAYKVYIAKEKTDDLTEKIFKKSKTNDESDAFRHFVWSALLTQDLGPQIAQTFLNAHENDPSQKKTDKEMDIFNNQQGMDFIVQRQKEGKSIELADIEKEALERLRKKTLRVNKESLKKIPGGHYSK